MNLLSYDFPKPFSDRPYGVLCLTEQADDLLSGHVFVCGDRKGLLEATEWMTDPDERQEVLYALVSSGLRGYGSTFAPIHFDREDARLVMTALFEEAEMPPGTVGSSLDCEIYAAVTEDGGTPVAALFFAQPDGACIVYLMHSLEQYRATKRDLAFAGKDHNYADQLTTLCGFEERSERPLYRITGNLAILMVRGLQHRIDREATQAALEEARAGLHQQPKYDA